MLDSESINNLVMSNVSVRGVDEIKKAVVDMNAAGVDPGTADRQMASFRQLFIGFCRFSISLPPTNATPLFCLPAAFSINNRFSQHVRRTNSIMSSQDY